MTGLDARSRLGPWLGGAILLALVTLMVVVAALRGTVVAGQPVATLPPDPPEPGDCLLDYPFEGASSGFVMTEDDQHLPAWRTGRCTGARTGEVVTVGAGRGLAASFRDGTWAQCWRDASQYLGLPDPAAPGRLPNVGATSAMIGPDPRQRAAGQDWSACVVLPTPNDPELTVGHSLRDAWSRSEDRKLLALCLTDERLLYPVGCRLRHGVEQVSSWPGDPARSGGPDAGVCRQDAVDALGSPAAIDRGDLSTIALPTRWDDRSGQQVTGPDAVSAVEPYVVSCLLVPADPARMLVGPLRGLEDSPVPLG